MSIVVYKRRWPESGGLEKHRISTKKEKRSKKERKGEGLWKLPQLWKSIKVAFGSNLLDDFHSYLKKPTPKTLRLLSQLPQARRPGLTKTQGAGKTLRSWY
jgi:hypothetical protein